MIQLSFPESKNERISPFILDSLGKAVLAKDILTLNQVLNLGFLVQGIYIITIEIYDTCVSRKVVKL
jgi:hypothetical protein